MRKQGALLVAGVLALVLAGCGSGVGESTTTPSATRDAPAGTAASEPKSTPTPTPTPTPEDDPRLFDIGEPVTIAESTLTVTGVEVVAEVPTVDGAPITAAAGEQLVLFRMHYVNGSKQTADLSCAGAPDWYIQVFDTQQRELAQVFETYRIPGNPECNAQLLSGQEADWSLVFRSTEGATPMALQITDSRTFDDFVAIDLTGQGLTISES